MIIVTIYKTKGEAINSYFVKSYESLEKNLDEYKGLPFTFGVTCEGSSIEPGFSEKRTFSNIQDTMVYVGVLLNIHSDIDIINSMKNESEDRFSESQRAKHGSMAAAVDPAHYKEFMLTPAKEELQWLEAKMSEKRFEGSAGYKAILLQADKYQSRLGGKDNEVQEIMKAVWYLKYAAAYLANGMKPVLIKDVDDILEATLNL